jgi:hypothetical protein
VTLAKGVLGAGRNHNNLLPTFWAVYLECIHLGLYQCIQKEQALLLELWSKPQLAHCMGWEQGSPPREVLPWAVFCSMHQEHNGAQTDEVQHIGHTTGS